MELLSYSGFLHIKISQPETQNDHQIQKEIHYCAQVSNKTKVIRTPNKKYRVGNLRKF